MILIGDLANDLCACGHDCSDTHTLGWGRCSVEGCHCPEAAQQWDELLDPVQWQERTGIRIMDPDGWRGMRLSGVVRLWEEAITREEFLARAMYCTVGEWPRPHLLDEPEVATTILLHPGSIPCLGEGCLICPITNPTRS